MELSLVNNFQGLRLSNSYGARKLLQYWLENHMRRVCDFDDLWNILIAKDVNTLGATKHILLEKVALASQNYFDYSTAQDCIRELYADFPKSIRIKRLENLTYRDPRYIVSDRIFYEYSVRNRIAILRALGHLQTAIDEVRWYMKDIWCGESYCWQELCDLYLQTGQYELAAVCAEELLIADRYNYRMHQQLAEIRYTMGGLTNLEIAKIHYRYALKLYRSPRCLFGQSLVSNNLVTVYRFTARSEEAAWRSTRWVGALTAGGSHESHGNRLALLMDELQLASED